jgi:hypothetical protein
VTEKILDTTCAPDPAACVTPCVRFSCRAASFAKLDILAKTTAILTVWTVSLDTTRTVLVEVVPFVLVVVVALVVVVEFEVVVVV